MTKDEVVTYLKTQERVAGVVGITQVSVSGWPKSGELPPRISGRIIGSMTRKGIVVPKSWLKAS